MKSNGKNKKKPISKKRFTICLILVAAILLAATAFVLIRLGEDSATPDLVHKHIRELVYSWAIGISTVIFMIRKYKNQENDIN